MREQAAHSGYSITGDPIKYQVGHTVHTKPHIFRIFYQQYFGLTKHGPP